MTSKIVLPLVSFLILLILNHFNLNLFCVQAFAIEGAKDNWFDIKLLFNNASIEKAIIDYRRLSLIKKPAIYLVIQIT